MRLIEPKYQGQTALIICTGPSLTPEVIEKVKESKLKKFGVNNIYKIIDIDVFVACNDFYFDHYWDKGLRDCKAEMWTNSERCSKQYGVNYIRTPADNEIPGLSKDPSYVHRHHGSGPMCLNVAYHYGITKMLLVGWDMYYPGKVDRFNYNKPRHFFGDDEISGKHFPMTGDDGEFTGLIRETCSIKPEDYGIEIINCTPNSAMTCFPMGNLEDYL